MQGRESADMEQARTDGVFAVPILQGSVAWVGRISHLPDNKSRNIPFLGGISVMQRKVTGVDGHSRTLRWLLLKDPPALHSVARSKIRR